jgi:CRISPR-associated protein Csb2
LPFVGHEHADGALLGIGLALPTACSEDERRAVHETIRHLEARSRSSPAEESPTVRLLLGDAGTLELERVAWGESPRKTLRSGTWTRASRFWASATPVALDRNPGDLHDSDAAKRSAAFAVAADLVRTAVTRVAPEAGRLLRTVDVVRSCVLPGTAKPQAFPRFPIARGRPQRVLVHVRLVFDEPVCGPLLVGAGRYYGLGLCMPLDVGHERGGPREEEVS